MKTEQWERSENHTYFSFRETAKRALTISRGYVIDTAVTPATEPARKRLIGGRTLEKMLKQLKRTHQNSVANLQVVPKK